MRGEHPITVRNNKVQIKLPICRNLTILQGNSATGKTTLIGLIAQYEELGESSGVVINCDAPPVAFFPGETGSATLSPSRTVLFLLMKTMPL